MPNNAIDFQKQTTYLYTVHLLRESKIEKFTKWPFHSTSSPCLKMQPLTPCSTLRSRMSLLIRKPSAHLVAVLQRALDIWPILPKDRLLYDLWPLVTRYLSCKSSANVKENVTIKKSKLLLFTPKAISAIFFFLPVIPYSLTGPIYSMVCV